VKKDRETGAVTKLDNATWQKVIDVNLTGATFMVRDVVAKMVETNTKGVVVNIELDRAPRERGQSNYAAAKAALADEHEDLVARVREVRHPCRRDRSWHGGDADDAGHEPKSARRPRRG